MCACVQYLFSCILSLFQVNLLQTVDRFQLKLTVKAREAYEQISRTAQSRLDGDQTKVRYSIDIDGHKLSSRMNSR
jgi:hypothetical protein